MIIRPAQPDDAADMTALLNEIIAIGGTTAYTTPFDEDYLLEKYIDLPELVCCHVAEIDNAVLGFQWLRWGDIDQDNVPKGWAVIASFVDSQAAGKGIGRQLFKATVKSAQRAGVKTIDATIRADNVSGLRYYGGMGFQDYDLMRDVPLSDGTRIDRVRKRFEIS